MSATAQRTKRRQQREETRRQILQAADDFLRERPFRELNTDAVMAGTGHTRTVFYRHFDDIPSLVLALMQERGTELVELAQSWAQIEQVGPDEARRRLGAFVDFHVRNGHLVRAVAEAARQDDAVEATYQGMIQGFIALTTTAIQTRVDSGELAPLDAPEVARALIWMLHGYLIDALASSEPSDPQRVLDAVWTIWTRTLFPR